ncbi:MAG: glycogen/starch/alpha-glucan phosphorylase [Geminicoccaceae bacterium]
MSHAPAHDPRRGFDNGDFAQAIKDHVRYSVGRLPTYASEHDWCLAVALAVRDRILDRWFESEERIRKSGQKRVYYLSMEFLVGSLLEDALANLGLRDAAYEALSDFGLDPQAVIRAEPDAALGNGGLGRLAACFLDSMANLGIAGMGYGIRYEHGLFRQRIERGLQVEEPEDWLTKPNPWQIIRAEVRYEIDFGGSVDATAGDAARWRGAERIVAEAFDIPIAGWQGRHVNMLRLWSSQPAVIFDLESFNRGDYIRAAQDQVLAQTISRVLYPDDSTQTGRELRLKQEMFFTSASLQDILRRYLVDRDDLSALPAQVAIQLNDTHPAIAVPELIRLLVDRHGLTLKRAEEITRGCLAYTNHTLLPEALERWPVDLMHRVLPRHMQIIEWLDARFVQEIKSLKDKVAVDLDAVRQVGNGEVRMGNMAFIGSHKINGVSALHTDLMRETVFRDLNTLYPERIINQTNGITPRRWLYECNPGLSGLISEAIGDGWIGDLERIEAIEPLADDSSFRERYAAAKRANKVALANTINARLGMRVDPDALFDIQIKRIHEYKRQLLNILEAAALYNAIRHAPEADWQPRVKVFSGKAAPSYVMAKRIIKLINDVAEVINNDKLVGDRLKIAFLPNYNVTLAEQIIPAADLSEQISTAGMEASGTGNMKFALNGALTIGTLDGANVEIRERVGDENIYIFGLKADEVAERRAEGIDPRAVVEAEPRLKAVLDSLALGHFSKDETDRFWPIVDNILNHDWFMVAPDFSPYYAAQRQIDEDFADHDEWIRRCVLNTANVGWFSSDRTIRGYATDIWQAMP